MIVVENEDARVVVISAAADAQIAGTQVAVFDVGRQGFLSGLADNGAAPRTILAVRRDDHPLLAQRMPALFPFSSDVQVIGLETTQRAIRHILAAGAMQYSTPEKTKGSSTG